MSPKLPRIGANELVRALKRDGWYQVRQHGSHIIMKHPTKPGRVTIPMHTNETLRLKTLSSILAQARFTIDELLELL
jgi:predicted RNA binding protein YcfA (HicA-like mRNA interferase family)